MWTWILSFFWEPTNLSLLNDQALGSCTAETLNWLVRTTYLEGMRGYNVDNRMSERINALYKEHTTMTQLQVRKRLTAWDNDQGRAMKHAETNLSTPARQYQWSPKLRNAGVVLRYWKLRLCEITHDEEYSDTFNRWEAKIKEYDATFLLPEKGCTLSLESIRIHLNANRAFRTSLRHMRQTKIPRRVTNRNGAQKLSSEVL
jgi:predicted secreted Zn-dependent protease